MFSLMIDFTNVLLAALLVGSMFGVWLVFNPSGLGAGSYVVLQRQAIHTLNPTMPPLGAATILVTLTAAALGRDDGARLGLLLVAAACFVAGGLVTRFLNQPINAIVMTWNGDAPPANWTTLRDQWWRWHCVRLAVGLAGFSALISAMLRHASVG